MADYIPNTDADKVIWYGNYAGKLVQYATVLGITPAQVTQTQQDYAMFKFCVDAQLQVNNYSKQWTKFKNLLMNGTSPTTPVPIPQPPAFGTTLVAEGAFPRVRKQIRTVKAANGYTDAIGKAMGIIGDDPVSIFDELQPVLTLVTSGGKVTVKWKKGKATSINIYADHGDGNFVFFANDAQPDFTDNTPLPDKADTWHYRAIYVIGDEEVGQFSDVVSILVKKFM